MLAEVSIRDLALLERVDLELAPGLNVVSGETGEGKSLLLQAVALLLGARSRRGLVRSGCSRAVVEGRFLVDAEAAAAAAAACDLMEPGGRELCLRRVVAADGGSRAYVNGSLAPVGLLARLSAGLADIHGQNEHLSLKKPAEQARVLDRYGGLTDLAARYAAVRRDLAALESRLQKAGGAEAARRDRVDLLRYQLGELEELDLQPGEAARLEQEVRTLGAAAELQEVLADITRDLEEGEDAAADHCRKAARSLQELVPGGPPWSTFRERLEGLALELVDVARDSEELRAELDADPQRLQEATARLDAVRSLARKHRSREEQLPELAAGMRAELEELEGNREGPEQLAAERERLLAELGKTGRELLKGRRQAAARLEHTIRKALRELRMPAARVRVETLEDGCSWDPVELGEAGPGAARFLVAANPGEPPQPLEQVASGGETARIMLALRGALAGHHRIPLLIFDEIDAGVGGRVGLPFGRRIARIAAHHQVLVVTHLPQVAAFARRHLRVVKHTRHGRTRTDLKVLDAAGRVGELADMLGGDIAPDAARTQAEALLREAAP